eukprot:jgi/Picsp_1/6073/NSC_03427-R1_protein
MEQQQGATGEQQDPASKTKKPLVPPPKDFVPSRALQNSKLQENLFQDGSYAASIGTEKMVQGPGSDTSGALSGSGSRQSNGQHGSAPSSSSSQNPLYKTELCRSWEEFGNCRYGTKCQFAHSREELRHVQRHPKYKTEVCRTFATTGTCPYGTRCRFIHQSTALAQLRTAKAGALQAVGQESVNAGLSRVTAGPEPVAPEARVPPSVVNSSVKNNPASFANVARGAVKVGGGMVPKDAAVATSAPQSSYNSTLMSTGSLLNTGNANSNNSLSGIDIGVAEFRVGNASSLSTSGATYQQAEDDGMMKHPAEYETALTAALDVLHFGEDHIKSQEEAAHFQTGGLVGSVSSSDLPPPTHGADLQNSLSASIAASSASHLGSTPVSPTRTGPSLSSSPHFPPVLPQKDSTLGTTSNSLGSNSNATSGGRRLPVFSNLVEK